jgi:uncharacterized 2Fe-2S/4Fe-4S cluster protein (DUF4445 family)
MLSEALRLHDMPLDMPCAGKGICKRCAVHVDGETRLACQTKAVDGMRAEMVAPVEMEKIATGEMVPIPPANPMFKRYGLSVDIGTTTLCAALFGADGRAETAASKNPQSTYGADVTSRIERVLSGKADALAGSIRTALAELVLELCTRRDIAPDRIDAAVVAGNTAMLYLLTKQNPEPLSHAPFAADRLFGEYLPSNKLNLPLAPEAQIYLPRCISAFVGADIATAILASDMCSQDETALLIDVGTNGEIALWRGETLLCCSTAAGPAFEGAGISQGVYSVTGAIDQVWYDDGAVCYSTIGNVPPIGICGSGIVDALATMLVLGVVDETGAFTNEIGFFEIANGVGVTAQDVRKIQLAKGSIRAGIETLLETAGVQKSEVCAFYIAGGFGSYLNLENAAMIGLIPPELLRCAKVLGNAAHTGASMILKDKALASTAEKLATHAKTIALDANPVFTEQYIAHMLFD